MKKDISSNWNRKSLILCSKILLNVLHNLSVTVLLPWQLTGVQTSPILKAFLATFGIPFSYLQMMLHIHDPLQAYKYVSLSLWPCLAFFELKITYILKSSGRGLEKSELPWEQIVFSHRCVFCINIGLLSFNGLSCKSVKIALSIALSIFEISHLICIFYPFFRLKYLRN